MKKIFKIHLFIGCAIVQFCLLSCSKNNTDVDVPSRIYIPQAAAGTSAIAFESNDSDADTISFGVAIGGVNVPAADVAVRYDVLQSEVDDYNTKNSTEYTLLPAGSYQLANTETVIKSGTVNSGLNRVIVSPAILTEGVQYLLPVTINTTGGIGVNPELKTLYITATVVVKPVEPAEIGLLPRQGWEVAGFSTEEPIDGYQGAQYVLDGNPWTYWGSRVTPEEPLPHTITIDMKKTEDLYGVYYQNRDFNGWDGYRATGVTVFVSEDGEQWTEHETFDNIPKPDEPVLTTQCHLTFATPVKARYFRLVIYSVNVGQIVFMSEIGAVGVIQ